VERIAMELALDVGNTLGECVLWCERTQCLLWTDIDRATLYAHEIRSGTNLAWPMPEPLGSFALTDDPDLLLLGLASQLAFFRFSTSRMVSICRIEENLPGTRINDGRCDRQGRFIFGTYNGVDASAICSFYRLDANLHVERLPIPHVTVANSICFSPDGRTMYYADSPAKAIRCCNYNPITGALSQDRLFADLADQPGEPDGSAIDSDGYLWNAQWGGGRILRFAPDGRIEREIELTAGLPTSVAFGGVELDVLYATSARKGLTPDELAAQPGAGGIFRLPLAGVHGLPEQRFRAATLPR
jgi:L-arabinonolactonase